MSGHGPDTPGSTYPQGYGNEPSCRYWRDSREWPLHVRTYDSGKEEKIIGRIFSRLMLWLFAMLVLSPWSAPATAQGSASAAVIQTGGA